METLHTTRIKVKEILFATDLSPASEAALKCAASLAKVFAARLDILHVVPLTIYPNAFAAGVSDLGYLPCSIAEESMSALEESPWLNGVRYRTKVVEGSAPTTIRSMAETDGVDLVVVGTHGAHGVEKALLGSVAEGVFRSVTCPVMTVGPNVKENFGGEFDSILFATDLSVQSLRAAQYAISWALETQAHLTLLHVIKARQDERWSEPVWERQRVALDELRSLIPDEAMFWCEPRAEVAFGDPEDEILKAAAQYKTNLIIMGVHRAGALASHSPWALASKIVQKAKCPVLTIRDHFGD